MEVRLSQSLLTGERDIDAGNEGLCFLLSRIFDPTVECRHHEQGGCDHSQCTKIAAILRYVARNFERQEAAMQDTGFPERERHKREHRLLTDGLRSMQAARLCAERDSGVVCDFVTRWANGHVRRCDRPLAEWSRMLRPRRRVAWR